MRYFKITFSNVDTINSLYITKSTPKTDGAKDTYYSLFANQKINLRSILFLFVKRYLKLESRFTQPENIIKCLIFDDTVIAKTGKAIEGISKVHNHVTQRYISSFNTLFKQKTEITPSVFRKMAYIKS